VSNTTIFVFIAGIDTITLPKIPEYTTEAPMEPLWSRHRITSFREERFLLHPTLLSGMMIWYAG
jgi:hypothetical protein